MNKKSETKPTFAKWLKNTMQELNIENPNEWIANKISEPKNPTHHYHVEGWLNGITLPSAWRFLQLCKIISIMKSKTIAEVITNAAEASFRSVGSGYDSTIGFADDTPIDLS